MKTTLRLRILKASIVSIAFFAGFSSCLDQPSVDKTVPSGDGLFEFKTVVEHDLNVSLSPRFDEIGVTAFEVYTDNPIASREDGFEYKREDVLPIFKALTDRSGSYNGILPVPSYADSLYIYVNRLGLPPVMTVPVTTGAINVSPETAVAKSKSTNAFAYNAITIPRTAALGGWNSWGFPDYLLPDYDVITNEYFNSIDAMVPAGVRVPTQNPGLLNANAVTTLKVIDSCSIDVTFVHEGAGYTNVLGYYYYPTGNPPTSLSDVDKYIVFPNASYLNSGGALYSGDKVRLKYWNVSTSQFVDGFPSGITIAWFLVANGYNRTLRTVTPGYYMFSSVASLNPEPNSAIRQHSLQFYDPVTKRVAITFEDIRRDNADCDQDFNDAIFFATATPYTAIETAAITMMSAASDRDGDDVPDSQDEFPDDPTLAYTVGFPAKGMNGTLAFEDLWPSAGDYDMNDLVVDYNTVQYYNGHNEVVKSSTVYTVRAVGARFQSGFAIELGVSPSDIKSLSVTGGSLTTGVFQVNSMGLELNQTFANIPLFDDAFKLFNVTPGDYINTRMNEAKLATKQVSVEFTLRTPTNPALLGFPPYNVYLVASSGKGERGKEVHLAGSHPTNLANPLFFSTGQDLTDPSKKRYYIDKNNMPFAIHLPVSFAYPVESGRVINAYGHFQNWSISKGLNRKDWYTNTATGYRNNDLIFTK